MYEAEFKKMLGQWTY